MLVAVVMMAVMALPLVSLSRALTFAFSLALTFALPITLPLPVPVAAVVPALEHHPTLRPGTCRRPVGKTARGGYRRRKRKRSRNSE